jgi:chromosome segregation ATPase
MAGRLSTEEAARTAALRDKLELEKQLDGLREQLGAQQASLRAQQDRLASVEADKSRLESEKTELERLSTAQAAQVQGTQDAIESTRLQLAREAQTGKILQNAREHAEKAFAALKAESLRALQTHKAELQLERERADAAIAAAIRDRDDAVNAARLEAQAAIAKARAQGEARHEPAKAEKTETPKAELPSLDSLDSPLEKLFKKEDDGDLPA